MQNIKTVEIHAPNLGASNQRYLNIDAENYDGARRYILDDAKFFSGPLSSENDVTVLPRRLKRTVHIKFGTATKNTISFKHYEDERNPINTVNIRRHNEGFLTFSRPGPRPRLVNAMNVISFPSCKHIIGNNKENLLIAVGEQTTIEADDGDDTLVSARGRHELIGGDGADTYVLHGPDVVDYLTINVIMGADGTTIRCKTTTDGTWMEADGRLDIEVLKHDHESVLLNTVEIIPAEGDESKNLGTIAKDTTNKKIIFRPGLNFNSLEKNKAKTLRIKFTTTGSMSTIKERGYGNQLRFESISSLDHLTASTEDNKLVFKDKSNPPRTVLIDHEWSNKLTNGIYTSVFDLIVDFVERFPLILFRGQDEQQYNRATSKDIIKFLYKHLENLVSDLGQDYDTLLDSTSLPSTVGPEIDIGNGQNIVLAKTRNKTYTIGSKSSGSIIIAKNFAQGTGNVTIKGGDDRNSLNAVVIGAGSDTPVEIQMGPHDLIITGARPSDVVFYLDNDMVHLKDSTQRDLIQRWNYDNCKNIIFKHSVQATSTPRSRMKEQTEIIFDCPKYVLSKVSASYRDFNPYSVSYDSLTVNKLKLNCPYNKEDVIIRITSGPVIGGNWINSIQVMLTPDPWRGYAKTRYQYLLIPTSYPFDEEFDVKMLVNAFRFRFKAGIKFRNGLVEAEEMCPFVKSKMNNPRKHRLSIRNVRLINLDLKC